MLVSPTDLAGLTPVSVSRSVLFMIHRRAAIFAGCIILLAVTLSGCSGTSNGAVATLATNIPHIVSYVEQFNGQSDSYKISIRYSDDPPNIDSDDPPDMVVGIGLAGADVIRSFGDLSRTAGRIGTDRFYRDLLVPGMIDDRQVLLPVSFTLPIYLTHISDAPLFDSELSLEIDRLRALSKEFTGDTRLGFSPRLDPNASYLFARFFGVAFRETGQGVLSWNDSLLAETVSYLNTWSEELNGGIENEVAVTRKYLFDPDYKLVADRRVRFAVSTIDSYLNTPAEIGEKLDFRWPGSGGSIFADDDIIYIGRLRESKRRRASDAFITWLFERETQAQLLETDRYRRVRSFGIAGGFSAIKAINSDEMTRYYPFLQGRVPAEPQLVFPSALPSDWREMRTQVLYPWLVGQAEKGVVEEDLGGALWEWERLKPSENR